MRRFAQVCLATAIVATAAVLGSVASADHCDGERASLHVFSGPGVNVPPTGVSGVPDDANLLPGTKVYGCLVGEDPNTNYIVPGATQLSVRFTQFLPGVGSITGHLTGLGLDVDITLSQHQPIQTAVLALVLGPSYTYDSPPIDINPASTLTPGTLDVVVNVPGAGAVADQYRTVAS